MWAMRVLCMVLIPLVSVSSLAESSAEGEEGVSGGRKTLQLSQGTMELGGVAAFNADVYMPDQLDNQSGFVINLDPMAGYFLAQGLEVAARLGFGLYLGEMYENSSVQLGFSLGVRYFLAIEGTILPYAGAAIGMNFVMPEDGDVQKNMSVELPIGMMVPLNAHVALDLGLRINYLVSLAEHGGSKLNIPVGYLGIRAFF